MKRLFFLLFVSCLLSCSPQKKTASKTLPPQYITVLGVAQDGGFPHIGCQKKCCEAYYKGETEKKRVVSLGLVDTKAKQKWLFDASPDISTQLATLEQEHLQTEAIIDGVFITHAHIGHYTGLMYFGREALGKKGIKVYAMPRMLEFLKTNGPWSQLVSLKNVQLQSIQADSSEVLNDHLTVTPFKVPHRDEYSETVGYHIQGPNKSALFIPDIDKWHRWERDIVAEVEKVDVAFLDATFFDQREVKRAMTEVPHPFVVETVALFEKASLETRKKVVFIHFNHTNPALLSDSPQKKALEAKGFRFAAEGQSYGL